MSGSLLQSRYWALTLFLLLAPWPALSGQSCTINSNFNGTAIPGGDYIWFTGVFKLRGVPSQGTTLLFTNSTITFSVHGVPQTIDVPAARLNFSPTTTTATTSYDSQSSTWTTNLPSSALSGNEYLTAVAVQVPSGGWPGGINPVSWSGTFESNTTGMSVQWQWAAAVYSRFSSDYTTLGVKPVDDNHASLYQNSDHAGTPENFKPYVIGGARGGGGSNWTGSLSGTASCTIIPIPPPPPPLHFSACNPTSSLAVLAQGSTVTAYVPNGDWDVSSQTTGVQVVPIEPPGTPASISTPDVVNSCASNSVTGQTVCTANGTDVYLITGATLNATLTSGSNGATSFSGGNCYNCGVVIESNSNTAAIAMGLSGSPSGSGIQFLNLNNNTLSAPIATSNAISEDLLWDPLRNLIVSPNESGVYDLFQVHSGSLSEYGNNIGGTLDSAGEDCLTGIGLSTDEYTSNIVLTDFTQANYSSGTWSAPLQFQYIPEWDPYDGPEAGTDGVAVATGSHFGIVTGEYPFPPSAANAIMAIELPSTSGLGTPALQDYAVAAMPNDPAGNTFSMGCDPHTVTAYVSPSTGNAMGLLTDYGPTMCYAGGTPQYIALVDLQALLNAPRVSGTHTVDPNYNLVANQIVTFVAAH